MKIVYIASSIIPSESANSVHVMKMCQAFSDVGNEVHLIVPYNINKQISNIKDVFEFYGVNNCFQIHKLPLPKSNKKLLYWSWSAADYASRLMPDLVYARDLYACLISADKKIPVIFEIHSLNTEYINADLLTKKLSNKSIIYFIKYSGFPGKFPPLNGVQLSLNAFYDLWRMQAFDNGQSNIKKILSHNNLIFSVSITNSLKKDIIKYFQVLEDKVLVAADGADPPRISGPDIKLQANQAKLNVGYCGHLYSGKGMEIISELVPRCPEMFFHIVGGTDADLRYWNSKLQHHENIKFYGYVSPHSVSSYVKRFDVCLLPNQPVVRAHSHKGGLTADIGSYTSPLKMFEYMALGKPIIASDIPVLKEILEDRRNALLCPHDDPEAWRRGLKELENKEELRSRIAGNALQDFTENYTWKKRAERILSHTNHVH